MEASQQGAPWPALGWEELPWVLSWPRGTASRAQIVRHRGPYPAAVVPGIAAREVVLRASVLAHAEDATAEIVRFDESVGADLIPFQAVLLRSESAASSQIEHLTASARAIAESELGLGSRRNAALVVANTRALVAAIELAGRVDAASVLAMHRVLLGESDPEHAGRWREEQVWVGGSSLGPHDADFVPPRHGLVPAALDDLFDFIHREDLPVLAHLAVAHAQLETVHPFTDGNGRTGRAVMQAMARAKGLTRSVTVPLSAGLLHNTDRYVAALTAYRGGDVEPIVTVVADAAFAAVGNARHLVEELHDVRSSWEQRVRVRRGASTWRIADLLLRSPVLTARAVAEELGVAVPNAHRALAPLVDAGVLTVAAGPGRAAVWRSEEVLHALDAFARRAGRRRSAVR